MDLILLRTRDITLAAPHDQGSILGLVVSLVFIKEPILGTTEHRRRHNYMLMITKYHIRLSVMVSNQIWLDCRKGQIGDNYKMILNETKTKVKQATGKRIEKRMNKQQLQIKLNATELKQVNSQKILGVAIDHKLPFDDHIDELCNNKLCQKIVVFSRIKKFLPLEQRKAYDNDCISCLLLEFAEGFSSPEAMCTRLTSTSGTNSVELLIKLNWLPLHLEVKVSICIQVRVQAY